MTTIAFVSSFVGGRIDSKRNGVCLKRRRLEVSASPASQRLPARRKAQTRDNPRATAERLPSRQIDWERTSQSISYGFRRVNVFQRTKYDKDIVRLAVPSYASMLMDPLSSLVDTFFVGRLGVLPLAGVGVANSLFSYFSWMFFFLVSTTTAEVAAAATCKSEEERQNKISRTVCGALLIALGIGTLSMSVAWTCAPFLVSLFGASAQVSPFAIQYLRFRALALPAHMCFFVLSGVLRGLQDFKSPLFASIICNVSNVVLDALFMFGLHMGVAGIAGATTIAQVASTAVMFMIVLSKGCIKGKHMLQLPSKETRDAVLRPGAVMVLEEVSESATLTLACSMATRLGTIEAAAMALSRQLWNVVGVCWWPLSIVAQSMAARFFAAGKSRALQVSGDRLMQIAFVASSAVAVAILFGSHFLPGLFISDTAVRRATEIILPIFALTLPFDALCDVLDCALTGCKQYGYVARSMFLASGVSVGLLFFLLFIVQIGLPGAWIALCSMSVTRLVLVFHRYLKLTAAT